MLFQQADDPAEGGGDGADQQAQQHEVFTQLPPHVGGAAVAGHHGAQGAVLGAFPHAVRRGHGIAFRYLVKPLDQTLFAAAMDAVLQELNSKHFTIEYDGVTMSLETSDIYFLESHGHKVLIHCKEQDLTLRMSIPEALEQLPKRCFVSPHKSYLVNMEHIVYATGTAVFLSSGHQLPISRRKRQEFNQIFNAYLGR